MARSLESRKARTLAAFAAPAALFMVLVFAIPLAETLAQSFSDPASGGYTLAAYRKLASPLVAKVAWRTARIVLQTVAITTLLAYPVAYYLAQLPARKRATFTVFVLVPFWTSVLVKSFAFTVILGRSGLVNSVLAPLGIGPLKLVFNDIGVAIGMCHYFVPFMVFPILSNLLNQPAALATAASIMGAGKLRTFWSVTLPLSLPGVAAGALLVMTLSLGFYIVPALLGGRGDMMLANLVDFYARELVDWPVASALSVLLTIMAICAAASLRLIPGGSSLIGGKE